MRDKEKMEKDLEENAEIITQPVPHPPYTRNR